ncbi:GNAT family N-acetyltransferase [Uliginosibacterium sp. 31-16]|uniref:GNAT family N-acetyltransferase n=1 Tax=Uliginosibacterium sp. 31-16 TaxID=3068315 RepID=UPI00273F7CA2|nr:GNAT family N-acetyltransferase [Uliginosibacterium sp. 31-16]MDP5240747.1 GNAT family N-acetyltransferase [Uliginosibacterium sp. 31-16]
MPELLIRAMRLADLPGVFALQCRAHPADYHEPLEALASRLRAGHAHCFVAECVGELLGYVFAHPWSGEPPPLHVPLPPSRPPDHVFLHDLAVCQASRRRAAGGRLHDAVLESAVNAGLADMQLVAVGAARVFWLRKGFVELPQARLHPAYGDAVLMRRELDLRDSAARTDLNQ